MTQTTSRHPGAEIPWKLVRRHTFEGTETMQTLIVGREVIGIGAFT